MHVSRSGHGRRHPPRTGQQAHLDELDGYRGCRVQLLGVDGVGKGGVTGQQRDDGVLRLHATLCSVSMAGRLATCSAQTGLRVRRTRWLVLHRGCSREAPAGECAAPAASMGAALCGALAPSASIARPPGRVLDYCEGARAEVLARCAGSAYKCAACL